MSKRSSRPTASGTTRSAAAGGAGNQDQQQDNTQTEQGQGTAAATPSSRAKRDKKFGPRTSAGGVSWSQDNRKFSVTRTDQRKVADLWVINSLANPRPTLETYKYAMPGEENQPQAELHVVDIAAKKATKLSTTEFKDQQMGLATAPSTNLQREKGETPSLLAGAGQRQDLLQPHQPRPEAHRHRVGRHDHGRAEGRRCRSGRTLTSSFSRCACSTAASS